MRHLRILLAVAVLPASAHALTPDLAGLDELPLHVVPEAVTAKALSTVDSRKGRGPAIFAVTADLPVPLAGGAWDRLDQQTDRWRTRVYSAGALSLLMEFGEFRLPPGAELWIYDVDGKVVQGPYDASNHSPEGSLWTAMVPGETAVIELRTPHASRDQVRLGLARLGHGFKNTRDLGESGACNINTVCPLGDNWRDEIRATVKLQIPAGGFVGVCSGTLINNLAQDNKPYILTADHCGVGESGSPASGVVVYWNFQNTSCSGADNARDSQNQTGTILRADDEATDMTLLELSSLPSASYNVYYAGWDSSGAGGTSGVSIHHPSGDAKKISEFTTALQRDTVQIEGAGSPQIPAWRVSQWQQGTTEQGSSGSGLWNQERLIVGTLSGGSALCVGSSDNNQPDFYARLDAQWQARASLSGQLKVWLDPNNTGLRKVAGKNPGSATATPLPTGTPGPTPTPTAAPTSTPVPTADPGDDDGGGGGAWSWLTLLLGGAALAARRRQRDIGRPTL